MSSFYFFPSEKANKQKGTARRPKTNFVDEKMIFQI